MAETYTNITNTIDSVTFINNVKFIKFGIHLFLGQKGTINNIIKRSDKPFLKPNSTSMSTVKATLKDKAKFRESCINFPTDLKNDKKMNEYITELTTEELKTVYNNEDRKVNDDEIGNTQLGASDGTGNDKTGIKRALKAVVECFIRKDAKKNNNYDLFRKWLTLDYALVEDDTHSRLAFNDNAEIKMGVIIDNWIKYRIENSKATNIQTFKNIDNIVNTLLSSAFITEKNEVKVIGKFDDLSVTASTLNDIKKTFDNLSDMSRYEYRLESAKKGNSLYNDLLVQNQLMRYFIKEADKDAIVEPNNTIDKIIIDLQYFQCKVLVAILDKANNGLNEDKNTEFETKLNSIAANTNKFTGDSTNAAAGAAPGDKPGWRWSGGSGDAGTPNNLHDVALQSKVDIKYIYYNTMLVSLKTLYETKTPQIATVSHITPLEHLQLIADLAVAKYALKLSEDGKDYGELNISNAGLIAYRIHEDIKNKVVKDVTFNEYNGEMKFRVDAYQGKADTNGDGNNNNEFKAIVGQAPSMRIAIVGNSSNNNLDGGKINITNVPSHIDKIAAIHYAIFRSAAEAADMVDPKNILAVFNHDTGCKAFADVNKDDALTDPNKPIWKRAIKAAISTANTCFSNITFP